MFTYLGVARLLYVWQGYFVKKVTSYENDMTQFVFIFSTWIKCKE